MNCYKVVARVGHLGAGSDGTITFAIEADTTYDAMQIAKKMPMVKHGQANAIKSLELITREEFDTLRKESAYKKFKR